MRITDWHQRRVWIIGASSGIGAALAQLLGQKGARLALTSRRSEALQALSIPNALCLPADATNPQAMQGVHDQLLREWGSVDLIVYMAGDYEPTSVLQINPERARHIIDVNFTAAMHLTHLVVPHLQPGQGVAWVASVAGYRGLPHALPYGPSKAALIHWAQCMRLELQPKGIGVWLVNPGFVRTRLTAKNAFDMPFIITPQAAAQAMVKGWAKGQFEIHFPKRFSYFLKALNLLPWSWYEKLITRWVKTPE